MKHDSAERKEAVLRKLATNTAVRRGLYPEQDKRSRQARTAETSA